MQQPHHCVPRRCKMVRVLPRSRAGASTPPLTGLISAGCPVVQAQMSCGGEPEDVAPPAATPVPVGRRPPCYKCKAGPAVALTRMEPSCRDCFIDSVTGRFKSCMSTRLNVRFGARVLVPFSGGPCSR